MGGWRGGERGKEENSGWKRQEDIPSIIGVLFQGVLGNCLESLLDVDGLLALVSK